MIDLNKKVQYVKNVGPNRVKLLNKLDIYTLQDLITYFPRTYENRGLQKKLTECINGEEVLITAQVASRITEIFARRMKMYKLVVRNEGIPLTITWYNQSYLKNVFKIGTTYNFYGKIEIKDGRYEMKSPIFEISGENKNTGKIIPIYPLTYGVTQNVLRKIIENGIDETYRKLEETLPEYIIDQFKLENINEAIKKIHFPENKSDYLVARYRLVFEELLGFQLALLNIKKRYKSNEKGIQFDKNVKISDVINVLPFRLTKSQLRVLEEIDKDMESTKPMNRLLQGDVGSGKTVVSQIAAYKAVKSGYQVAVLVPTSILASQHFENFKRILDQFGIRLEILISSITKKKKQDIKQRLLDGEIDIIIGTHALIEEDVSFKNLGLVITDEQHRFGVKQRAKIVSKGKNPDLIVMSATPIPRTLALILYGDLDISIIDELPPNRKKVDTFAVGKSKEEDMYEFVKKQIDEGRQCYIVCPMVEEDEEQNLKSVIELTEKLKTKVFNKYNVEYLHGKIKQKEKDEIMLRFKEGKIDVLVSTTVIEVGVDVPNANIMIIEDAERFGLAQLHQLRGRVGRGEYKSYCILKYSRLSEVSKERLKIMCQTNDGFLISEKDLELRGSGDFFGTAQHGLPEMKIANLFEDVKILKEVQILAQKILKNDPNLEKKENQKLKKLVADKFTNRIEM